MKSKKSNLEDDSSSDLRFLAKIIMGGVIVMGIATAAGLVGSQYWEKLEMVNLEKETLEIAEITQQYVDLEGRFNQQLDTTNHGSKYISSILPKKYHGGKMIHSLDGEIFVGVTGMSGKEGQELFITLKDIKGESNCVQLVHLFDKTFPVIAVGESGDNFGMKTGMFVKNVYAQRTLNPEHVTATCFSLSQKTGKVNVSVWLTKDTKIITKNTEPGTSN